MTESGDDVERLFHRLVEVLAGREPHLLDEPIAVSDLYERLVPYRIHRTSLGFDTNQDYEMALLRLLAGEHGLADLEQDDARRVLGEEARSANPDPGAFRAWSNASVRLNPDAINTVLQKQDAYAPPAEVPVDPPPAPARPAGRPLPFEFELTGKPTSPAAVLPSCPHCEEVLPRGRVVVYCPFCGGNVTTPACPHCGTALESAWRHCITCGHKLGGTAERRGGG